MRLPPLKIGHKGLILVAIPLAFEVGFVFFLFYALAQADAALGREATSKEIIYRTGMVARDAAQGAFSVGAYYYSQSDFLKEHYLNNRANLLNDLREEEVLLKTANKKDQLERLEKIKNLASEGIEMMNQVMHDADLKKEGKVGFISQNALLSVFKSRRIMNALLVECQFIMRDETAYKDRYAGDSAKTRNRVYLSLWVFVLCSFIVAIGSSIYFSEGITKRLHLLMQNTRKVPRGEELSPPLNGQDEIAQLDGVFHEMVDDLYKAQRAKQYLLSMVSHDIRSPLTSVQGLLTLLSVGTLGELNEKGKQRVQATECELDRLIKMTGDLLDVERLASGNMKMEIARAHSSTIIEKAIASLQIFAEQNGVEIDYKSCDIEIQVDQERMIQVLVNLLSNAIKYSQAGSTVQISTEVLSEPEVQTKLALFKVKDTGRGIPLAFQETIFEQFQQVENADASELGGKGLGLAICKSIVEAHGGKIGVDSEVQRGSTFWFSIPLV